MKPITFSCEATLPQSPVEIVQQILDVTKWPNFQGYGPIPGIKAAEFEHRTQDMIGSRIRVLNRDGSTHVEEIVEWIPDKRLQLLLHGFSPPLSRLADFFIETWEFGRQGGQTVIVRSFDMYPKTLASKPVLWLISFLLKGAINRHLRVMNQTSDIRSMAD